MPQLRIHPMRAVLTAVSWNKPRGLVMGCAAAVLVLLALPGAASASTDFTWSGTAAIGTNASSWSNMSNWVGGAVPGGSIGTLNFPNLGSNTACAFPASEVCGASNNDISGLSVNAISINDGRWSDGEVANSAGGYQISGNGITLGAGGITAAPSSGDTAPGGAFISLPITLGANQTWSIAGGTEDEELAVEDVTGTADTLGISFSGQTFLSFFGDAEVGAFTATPSSSGFGDVVAVGDGGNPAGSLNYTDGNPVSLTGGVGLLADPGQTGPLSMSGGRIQIGDGSGGDNALTVAGAVTLDSTSDMTMFIPQAGTVAGTDYSQLSATGNINLGGSGLYLVAGVNSCPTLNVGDVLRLVTTTGSLTGTFANLPDGTTLTLNCSGGTAPTVRINYTSDSVTATVLTPGGSTATTTSLSASPSGPVTNQAVTLTATVGPDSVSPSGSVEFDNSGTPISGCTSQPVSLSGSAYTATCTTSFTATSSPESLTATFTPSSSSLASSTSQPDDLVVGKDSTTTALSASNATLATGQTVTYTATVTPVHAQTTMPTGSIEFSDSGTPISGCSSQPLSIGASSSSATCTVSYSSSGAHAISVSYGGDGNFTGSASSAQTVTVQTTPPPSDTSPPTISGTTTQGQMLTEAHGGWTNNPTSFAFQWEDCDSSGNNCSAIAGASGQTYTLTATDVGHTIRVQEIAANAGGSGQAASSAPTSTVQALITVGAASVGSPRVSGVSMSVRTRCTGAPGSTCRLKFILLTTELVKRKTVVGVLTRRAATRRKQVLLATATAILSAGQARTVVLALDTTGRRLLARYHKLKVKLVVLGPRKTVFSKAVTFRAKRRRAHGR